MDLLHHLIFDQQYIFFIFFLTQLKRVVTMRTKQELKEKKMTPKQSNLLHFIRDFTDKNGYAPSFEEMRGFMGLKSKSGIHRLLKELENQNTLTRQPHQTRGVMLPQKQEISNDDLVDLPLYGKIAAGLPIEAIANPTEKISVPSSMIGSGEYYALTVEGDSMIGVGIMDGDTVIIRHAKNAENGQIVVALVDEYEVTLKKWHKKGHSVALEPANPAYETRVFSEDRVEVQGILAGLMRRYESC